MKSGILGTAVTQQWLWGGVVSVVLFIGIPYFFPWQSHVSSHGRMSGDAAATVQFKHGSTLHIVPTQEVRQAHDGDSLRFKLRARKAGFVGIAALDTQGNVHWVVPADADGPAVAISVGETPVDAIMQFDVGQLPQQVVIAYSHDASVPCAMITSMAQAWRTRAGSAASHTMDPDWYHNESILWTGVFEK